MKSSPSGGPARGSADTPPFMAFGRQVVALDVNAAQIARRMNNRLMAGLATPESVAAVVRQMNAAPASIPTSPDTGRNTRWRGGR